MHSDSKKANVQRRDHANFAPNSRERIAKFPKNFGAPRAQNLRELGRRGCASLRISLQLVSESAYALAQDNARVQRRDDANVAQKTRKKFAKSPEIRHAPRAHKQFACTRPARAARTLQRRGELIDSALHTDPKKKACSVGITQILRPTRAKKMQNPRKFSARRARKSCVNSASVVSRTAELQSSYSPSRRAFLRKITRETSVEMTQCFRKNRAKNLQNFRKSGTPRAQKLRALGQRALRILHNVAES